MFIASKVTDDMYIVSVGEMILKLKKEDIESILWDIYIEAKFVGSIN